MNILFNSDFQKKLLEQIKTANRSILILSAFIKVQALKTISDNIPDTVKDVNIVARWQPNDLVSGASDKEVFQLTQEKGWNFFINENMHFKIYLIDEKLLFIGSANITQKGLGLSEAKNDEGSVLLVPTSVDIKQLRKYILSCCRLDSNLFSEIEKFLSKFKEKGSKPSLVWPEKIKKQLEIKNIQLWVNDLLFEVPINFINRSGKYFDHDCNLLGLTNAKSVKNRDILIAAFKNTLLWKWTREVIENSDSDFVRFGELSAKLHDDLLDDPSPYRKEVKQFVSNIFEWIRYLELDEIGIKRFNHTESLFVR